MLDRRARGPGLYCLGLSSVNDLELGVELTDMGKSTSKPYYKDHAISPSVRYHTVLIPGSDY